MNTFCMSNTKKSIIENIIDFHKRPLKSITDQKKGIKDPGIDTIDSTHFIEIDIGKSVRMISIVR